MRAKNRYETLLRDHVHTPTFRKQTPSIIKNDFSYLQEASMNLKLNWIIYKLNARSEIKASKKLSLTASNFWSNSLERKTKLVRLRSNIKNRRVCQMSERWKRKELSFKTYNFGKKSKNKRDRIWQSEIKRILLWKNATKHKATFAIF